MKNTIADHVVGIPISFAPGVQEHVRLGPKTSETVKRKLKLGARLVKGSGMQRIFEQLFSIGQEEKLLKVSQCYWSTTAGPIAGLLAFCSENSLRFTCAITGEFVRSHYKELIPLRKIKRASQSENVKNPREKYIEIVTVDNFDFWSVGFVNYKTAFKYLKEAISQSSMSPCNR